MPWCYRVIRWAKEEYISYGIHEVYSDSAGNIDGYTIDGIAPLGETLDDLKEDMKYMAAALLKPVLQEVDGKLIECT